MKGKIVNDKVLSYTESLETQLKKGFLVYCVLKICFDNSKYTSDITSALSDANIITTEGTIYPLLKRLHRDEILSYEWRESEQGPPRKYYKITDFGKEVFKEISVKIDELNKSLENL